MLLRWFPWLTRTWSRVRSYIRSSILNLLLPAALPAPTVTSPIPSTSFHIIGTITSAYKEKFGTPRQGSLAPHGRGCLTLNRNTIDVSSSLDSLQAFSHCWVIFIFHTNTNNLSKKRIPQGKVRPPQGGGVKIGVFASRSPHRPNPIGLTLVKIDKVDVVNGVVYLSGLDLCDGTPVLDVKPFVEHVDFPGVGVAVTPRWVRNPKFDRVEVTFELEAEQALVDLVDRMGVCEWYEKGEAGVVRQAIVEVISLDPRDLTRGRGAFDGKKREEEVEAPISGSAGAGDGDDRANVTSFIRRQARTGATFAALDTYVRFDALKVVFRPVESKGFHVFRIVHCVDGVDVEPVVSKSAAADAEVVVSD